MDDFATAALARRLSITPGDAAAVVAEVRRRRAPRNLEGLLRVMTNEELLGYLTTSTNITRSALPPPCGNCDAQPGDNPSARMVIDETSGLPRPCPRCHPKAVSHAS
ncbi:MAG: hypothetical protein ACJ72N_14145 [Labedaea sp.]